MKKTLNPGGHFPITTGQPQIKWYNCPPHYPNKPLISFMFLDLIRLHQLFAFNSLPMARKTLAWIMRRTLASLTICHKSHNYLRLCPFHSRSEQRVIQDKVNVHTCIINCKDSLSLRTRKMNELTTQKSVKQTDRQTDRKTVIQTVTQPQISTIHGKNEVFLSTAIGVLHHQLSGPLHSSSHLQTVRWRKWQGRAQRRLA